MCLFFGDGVFYSAYSMFSRDHACDVVKADDALSSHCLMYHVAMYS